MATSQELEETNARLDALIKTTADQTVVRAERMFEPKWKAEVAKLSSEVDKKDAAQKAAMERVTADAKSYTEVSTELVAKKITALFPPLEERITRVQEELLAKIDKEAKDVRQVIAEELSSVCEKFDDELIKVKQELAEALVAKHQAALDKLAEVESKIGPNIEEARQEAKTTDEKRGEITELRLKQVYENQLKEEGRRDEKSQRVESEIYLKIERLDDLLKELQEEAHSHTTNARADLEASISQLREQAIGGIEKLDENSTKLREAMAEVENMSTRRVDWIIKNVSQRMRPTTPGSKASLHTSWFSPKFNMAGAHGLQMEVQLFRPSDPPVQGESAGDCAVFLWACKGMSLVYKLHIGSKAATLEKVFNGRVPYGTKRLCFLKDQINRENDTLKISVEILEAVREVEHPIKPPPPPTDLDELELAVAPLEGMLVFKRHMNNRLLDQVKSQVESMRSRMVRRIDWRLEQAGMLRRCFPPGEAICSVPFAAAGIENMQLMFYPSGYNGCTDGYCSFFLHGPAGTTLKCSLLAGTQRRDASHFFAESGAFGRTNFCRYDSAIDEEEDCILLALEIEEAHQDVQAMISHPVVQPGDRRTQALIDGDLPQKVESVVKLKRSPGKAAAGMNESRILPSLWTPLSLGEQDSRFDGMKTFDDIGKSAGGKSRRPRAGDQSSQLGDLSVTKSMSSFKEEMSAPLPRLGQSDMGGGDWDMVGGSGNRPKMARNASTGRVRNLSSSQ